MLVFSSSDCKTITSRSSTHTDTESVNPEQKNERRHIPSASTALIVGGILGLVQAIFLIFGAKPLLHIMGVKSVSAFSFSLLTSIISVALHLFISAAFIHWRSDDAIIFNG